MTRNDQTYVAGQRCSGGSEAMKTMTYDIVLLLGAQHCHGGVIHTDYLASLNVKHLYYQLVD